MRIRVAALLLAVTSVAGLVAMPAATASPPVLDWVNCEPVPDPDPRTDAECATLSVPIDWRRPDGPRFDLALARRAAIDKEHRIGSPVPAVPAVPATPAWVASVPVSAGSATNSASGSTSSVSIHVASVAAVR